MSTATDHCIDHDCDGEWHVCNDCDGSGLILDDCFEDTCPCADPESDHDMIECPTCSGSGGWDCPAGDA
jgi:hypothetical protein